MRLKPTLVAAALLAAATAMAAPAGPYQEAEVTFVARSLFLGSSTAGSSSRVIAFKTANSAGALAGNGEFKPSSSRPGSYEAGYIISDTLSPGATPVRIESGVIYVPLPLEDTNENGVPDLLDPDVAVDFAVTAEVVSQTNRRGFDRITTSNAVLRLVRSSGSAQGSYTLEMQDGLVIDGTFTVVRQSGAWCYRRSSDIIQLALAMEPGVTNTAGIGRVLDADTISFAALKFRTVRSVRILPSTLHRLGNTYVGDVTMSDGLLRTRPADYRSWIAVVRDLNDTNTNGVPDLSDARPPTILVQPSVQIVARGTTATVPIVVEGTGPFEFVWQQNGAGVSNPNATIGTNGSLALPNVSDSDRGSYRVFISGPGGTVWSDSTSVSLQ